MAERENRSSCTGHVHHRGNQPTLGGDVLAPRISAGFHVSVAIVAGLLPNEGKALTKEDVVDGEFSLIRREILLVWIGLGRGAGGSLVDVDDELFLAGVDKGRVVRDNLERICLRSRVGIGREGHGNRAGATAGGRSCRHAFRGILDRPVHIAGDIDRNGSRIRGHLEGCLVYAEFGNCGVLDQEILDLPGTGLLFRTGVLESNLDFLADIGGKVDGTGFNEGPAEGGRIIDTLEFRPGTVLFTDPDRRFFLGLIDGGELVHRMLEGKLRGGRRGKVDLRGDQPGLGCIGSSAQKGAGLHAISGIIGPNIAKRRRNSDVLNREIAYTHALEDFRIRKLLGGNTGHRGIERNRQRLDTTSLELGVGGKGDFLRGGTLLGAVDILSLDFEFQLGTRLGREGLDDGVELRIRVGGQIDRSRVGHSHVVIHITLAAAHEGGGGAGEINVVGTDNILGGGELDGKDVDLLRLRVGDLETDDGCGILHLDGRNLTHRNILDIAEHRDFLAS